MVDQRLPELAAVITPARTDIVGVRQSGDTRDKKETIAQALSLIADGDIAESNVTQHEGALSIAKSQFSDLAAISQAEAEAGTATTTRLFTAERVKQAIDALASGVDLTAIAAGSAANPSLAWGDGDTGFYELSDGIINFTSQGVGVWSFRTGAILPFNAAGPSMLNRAATATVPTFNPNTADPDTGLGWASADVLSLIAGGVEGFRITEAAAVITNESLGRLLVPDGLVGVPSLSFANDPDTGFYKSGDSLLNASVDGVKVAEWGIGGAPHFAAPAGSSAKAGLGFIDDDNTGFFNPSNGIISVTMNGTTTWQFNAQSFGGTQTSRPAFQDEVPSAVNPTVLPNKDDPDTGMGASQGDNVTLIAGGIAALSLKEWDNGVMQIPAHDIAVTALAGGAQGGAGTLIFSYNVITVAASTGDSVTLPVAFFTGYIIFIKNDGANSVNVFPASGDDLGAGTDTAVAVAAGDSVAYISTVANATWTSF